MSLHLQSLYASSQDDHLNAVNCALKATGAFFEAIENQKDTNWFLPAVRVVTLQLRLCSIAADELLQRKGEKTKYILEAKELLERYMRLFNMDRSAKSKKMGNLFLFNHLIKVFFKINNLRMCSHVINQVNNNPAFPNLDTFSKAQVRLNMNMPAYFSPAWSGKVLMQVHYLPFPLVTPVSFL